MKRPASQYYWGDWRSDAALQSCSLTARGLWHEMNCIMHDCEPYGHLVIGGKPVQPAQLGRLVGVTERECKALLTELEDAGVFSRNNDGTIFSRRMVRDEEIRNARAAGGKDGAGHGAKGAPHGAKGGRPKGGGKGGSKTPLITPLPPDEGTPLGGAQKPPPSSPSSSPPSASSDEEAGGKPPNPPRCALPGWLGSEAWAAWKRHRKAMRKPLTADAEALSLRELTKMKADGYDPTAVIENAILKGWQGLYPPKDDAPRRSGRESTADHNKRAFDAWEASMNDGRTVDA